MSRIGGHRQLQWLSAYFFVLALLFLTAAVVGLATSRPGMAIIGLPLFAFMLLMMRLLVPAPLPRLDARLGATQERFFRRLGIKWLTGPDNDAPE